MKFSEPESPYNYRLALDSKSEVGTVRGAFAEQLHREVQAGHMRRITPFEATLANYPKDSKAESVHLFDLRTITEPLQVFHDNTEEAIEMFPVMKKEAVFHSMVGERLLLGRYALRMLDRIETLSTEFSTSYVAPEGLDLELAKILAEEPPQS
jgi:hypothetical protein